MAAIVVVGAVACDEVVRLKEPLSRGVHLNGVRTGVRLGGGGANTAVALAAAGHHTTLVASVGRDAEGDALIAELARAGVDTSAIARCDRPTTHSIVLVDPDGERTVVNVARCEEDAPPERLLAIPADAVFVRSRRLDLGPLLARKAADCLMVAHVPPIARGGRPAHVLVGSASDLSPEDTRFPLAMGAIVAGEPLRWVVVTAGPAGARAFSSTETLAVPAERVATVDTTGAGDAFAAGLVHALVAGQPMPQALALAVCLGTEATRCSGSAMPGEAVRRMLAQGGRPAPASDPRCRQGQALP